MNVILFVSILVIMLINILNLVDKLSTPIQFRTEAVEWKLICTYIV